MIKELGKFITDNVAGLVLAESFFVGHQPINAGDTHTVLIESGGIGSSYLPDYKELRYQVLCKSNNYQDARDKAWAIYSFLHGKIGYTLPVLVSDEVYLADVIQAVQTPQYIGLDDRGFHVVTANYVFKVQEP